MRAGFRHPAQADPLPGATPDPRSKSLTKNFRFGRMFQNRERRFFVLAVQSGFRTGIDFPRSIFSDRFFGIDFRGAIHGHGMLSYAPHWRGVRYVATPCNSMRIFD
jgi:hypothetical protein